MKIGSVRTWESGSPSRTKTQTIAAVMTASIAKFFGELGDAAWAVAAIGTAGRHSASIATPAIVLRWTIILVARFTE
ncbi:MAG: hypothetical protein R2705_04955 [Ilumatobacteraceae bacterium]